MKLEELIAKTSLRAAGRSVGLDVQVVGGDLVCTPLNPDAPRYCTDYIFPSMKMVEVCRADDFDFFQPLIDAGQLTAEQMRHAAARYHLGKTRSGRPMFWMIDDMLEPLDAHIGADSWISTLLKAREPLIRAWQVTHCLFGLHLLHAQTLPIAIVESEATAVVLSELFPEVLWMAYATDTHLGIELFAPLEGRTVTIYPRTDPTGSTFLFFEELAACVREHYDIHISVASILEDHATEEQKERCIDLLEFVSLTAPRGSRR